MKICIVKLSALGDIVHAMVVLQYIKKFYPNAKIDWIVESAFVEILQNNPHIDTILPVNLKSIKQNKATIFKQLKLLKEYKKNNYDLVIDAQGLIKSALVAKLVSRNRVVGFCKNSIRESLASKFYTQTVSVDYAKNVIERNIKLMSEALDIEITKNDILTKEAFLFSKFSLTKKKKLLFVLGASRENKIYPKEKFVEIATALKDFQIDAIWANESEYKAAKYIHTHSSNVSVCNKMSLDELKSKIKSSALVIGGDTGPTHMAWALNIPSITIFGNTPEFRNTYITDINRVVKSHTKVNPLKLDKNDFSIKDINSQTIVNLSKQLLS